MRALTNLQDLELQHFCIPSEDCGALKALGRLESLEITGFSTTLPACLSALTGLRFLAIQNEGNAMEAEQGAYVTQALPHLRHLTHLVRSEQAWLRICSRPFQAATDIAGPL